MRIQARSPSQPKVIQGLRLLYAPDVVRLIKSYTTRRVTWATTRDVWHGSPAGKFALIGVVSLVTPFLHPEHLDRWFAWPTGHSASWCRPCCRAAAGCFTGALSVGEMRSLLSPPGSACALLCREFDQLLSLPGSPQYHCLGCRCSGCESEISPGWCRGADTRYSWLYDLCLLGIPWQSQSAAELPLMSSAGSTRR